ncbi:MAG TPA: hypothetical protein VN702_17770 [Acetobacteraceae bacterium]|nr:hypothetical protein [Acetobacteraceae bacterium]
MTLSHTLRQIAMSIRAEATVVDEGPASALRAQAQRLDAAVRQAERMEHVNGVCLDAMPLHPAMRVPGGMGGEIVR